VDKRKIAPDASTNRTATPQTSQGRRDLVVVGVMFTVVVAI